MTERRDGEPFETRFARLARAYTDPATERAIDPVAVAHGAMARRATRTWLPRPAARGLGRRVPSAGWAAAIVAVTLLGVVGAAILGRPSDVVNEPSPSPVISSGGPIPDVLRHAWQRPLPVAGPDPWGSGFLRLASELPEYGPAGGAESSRSAIVSGGEGLLVATATDETRECALGEVGTYRWSLAGKDTFLTLTAISTDACAAREKALAGEWVRADLSRGPTAGELLEPGTYQTSAFDPFGQPDHPGQWSYTVPAGWRVEEDRAASITLHRTAPATGNRPAIDTFVILMAEPRLAANGRVGDSCGPVSIDPGVGSSFDDIVSAISGRGGVASTPPKTITIAGFHGELRDLRVADDGSSGCRAPDGTIVAVPLLTVGEPGPGPVVGVSTDRPLRLVLVDLGAGRTMAVAILSVDPTQPAWFDEQVADAMPIVQSFELHPSKP